MKSSIISEFASAKSTCEKGTIFERNVRKSLTKNLNIYGISNHIINQNEYKCYRLTILIECTHKLFCQLAKPFLKLNFQFRNKKINVENQKYNLQITDGDTLEVKNSTTKKIFIFKTEESNQVDNYIWLISRKESQYEVKIFRMKSIVVYECTANFIEFDKEKVQKIYFPKENFQIIYQNDKNILPAGFIKAKYNLNQKRLFVYTKTLKGRSKKVTLKKYQDYQKGLSFKINFFDEELDGLFLANESFNIKKKYEETFGSEESFKFYANENESEDGFNIGINDLIFLEIKDSMKIGQALNQTLKHLRDLKTLCFQNVSKIHCLIILRGELNQNFKLPSSKISDIQKLGNANVIIGIIEKSDFFGEDVTKPLKLSKKDLIKANELRLNNVMVDKLKKIFLQIEESGSVEHIKKNIEDLINNKFI